MKKALILHGWFCKPEDHWYKSVGKELENLEYVVEIPFLKDNEKPNIKDWTKSALENFELDENTLLIGHSLGSILALKLVQNSNKKIKHLILTSAWDYWDLTIDHESFFKEAVNHKKIVENTERITVIISDNDPYVTKYHATELAKRLDTEIIIVKDGGHFQAEDGFTNFPQILETL